MQEILNCFWQMDGKKNFSKNAEENKNSEGRHNPRLRRFRSFHERGETATWALEDSKAEPATQFVEPSAK